MKKTLSIIAALALVFGMTQCKKAETPQSTTDEGIRITLTAGYGNGARTGFTPETGAFTWTGTPEAPEYIYVGGNSTGYLGCLTSTESGATVNFSGTITPSVDDATLYFFYLGKGGERTGDALDAVNFSNQNGTLADVTNYHIAISDGVAYTGQKSFNATLDPQVAFAYFDLSGFNGETVYLHGEDVYATATIDYNTGTIEKGTKGYINIGTASDGKYVALIPSTENETTLEFDSNGKSGSMDFTRGISAGMYYANNNAALNVSATTISVANSGTIPGLFSVAATDEIITKMVRFSKGNLQYNDNETNKWRFAPNQWDYVSAGDESNWVDLFSWGTWTTDGRSPLSISETDSEYTMENNDFRGGSLNGQTDWFTLSDEEWFYLFHPRDLEKSIYGMVTVNGVPGVVILPDDSELSMDTDHFGWNYNFIDASTWTETYEAAGAVFLPAAGMRVGNTIEYDDCGFYWSSSPVDDESALNLFMNENNVASSFCFPHSNGLFVRLVR